MPSESNSSESPQATGPLPPVGAARWSLALLLAINLINFVDRYVLAAVITPLREEWFGGQRTDTSEFWLGLLTTAFLLSYMCTAPVFGWLADRVSRWLLIGVAVIFWSLASGASGLATGIGMLLVTRLFVGVGEAAYGPAAPTILADLYPTERRGRILSYFYLAIPVGSALGFILGGQIAQAAGWRMAFYAVVPPGILLGLLCFLMRDPRSAGQRAKANSVKRPLSSDYGTLLRTPSYVWNTAGMTAMTFALGGVAAWMPDYIHDYRDAGPLDEVTFRFGAITVAAGLAATLLGGIVGDKLRTRLSGAYFIVSAIGMFLGLPFFLLTLYMPFPLAWVFVFLAEFCLFFNTGPTNAIIANVTNPGVRASAFAINIFMIHVLGDAISPPMIGAISGFYGGNMNIGFLPVTVAIVISGLCWLMGARHLDEDTERARSAERGTGSWSERGARNSEYGTDEAEHRVF